MRLVTLGTSCAQQTLSRSQSAHALCIAPSLTYLFDCGSSTSTNLLRANIKSATIQKIFITHLHTDHVIGLPSLLTDMLGGHGGTAKGFKEGEVREPHRTRGVVDVYGPRGIKELLRTTFKLTYTMLGTSFRVHELLFEEDPVTSDEDAFIREEHSREVRIANGMWSKISTDDEFEVSAVPILHSVPSLGYIVKEKNSISIPRESVGQIQAEFVDQPDKIRDAFKRLKQGLEVGLPSGTLLRLPSEKGRQIVILGDTCDASTVLSHVDAPVSLVLHEATNAFLPGLAKPDDTVSSIKARAIDRGHSTPEMAGEFARQCGSEILVLTHFSSRYSGEDNPGATRIMRCIENIAALAGTATHEAVVQACDTARFKKRPRKDNVKRYNGLVVAAWDGMEIDIPKTGIMLP